MGGGRLLEDSFHFDIVSNMCVCVHVVEVHVYDARNFFGRLAQHP